MTKATCRSWYVCPRGTAVYLYLTPDLLRKGTLKDWDCPNFPHCMGCEYVHIPSDKRRKKTCDFEYAYTEVMLDRWTSADEFLAIMDGCTEEAKRVFARMIYPLQELPFYREWLKENKAEFIKKHLEARK